jgi:antitoxin ParD1/3/4
MGAIERLTITMPSAMAEKLKASVASGEYASTSEVVREALRDWTRARDHEQRDLAALRELIRAGDASGPSIPASEVFTELRALIETKRSDAQ